MAEQPKPTSTAAKVAVGATLVAGITGILAAAFGGESKKAAPRRVGGFRGRSAPKSCDTPCGR